MREYIADRFETYEMLASALPSPPYRFKPPDITANSANSATTQVSDKYEDEDGEYEDDEEQPSDSDDEANNVKPNEVGQSGDTKIRYVNPICLFCQKKDLHDTHWFQNCCLIKPSSKEELHEMLFCTLCLYLKKENTPHCCKEFYSRNRLFCEHCGTHTKLCKDKQTHEASYLPNAFSCDEGGPGQEEPKTGETTLATFVTIKDYAHSNGY